MGLQNTLNAQQNLHPLAAQALNNALQQSARNSETQYNAALEQLATTPNMAANINSTMEPEESAAPATLANQTQPTRLSNLGFSQLNAIASTTPSASYSPTTIPGGAIAQGLTNMFNVREQRRTQQAMLEMMRRQEEAAQVAAMQQRAAAQQQAAQQVTALQQLGYTPDVAVGLVAAGQGGNILGKTGGVAENYASQLAALGNRGLIEQQVPGLADVNQVAPVSPIDLQFARDVYGQQGFNQFEGLQQQAKTQQELAKADIALPQGQLALEKTRADIAATKTDTSLAPIKAFTEQKKAQIEALKANNELQRAQREERKLQDGEKFLTDLIQNAPNMTMAELQNKAAIYSGVYGGDKADLAPLIGEVEKLGTGKKQRLVRVRGNEMMPIEVAPTESGPGFFEGAGQVLTGAPLSIGLPATQPREVSKLQKAREAVQKAKPNTPEQKKALENLQKIQNEVGASAKRPKNVIELTGDQAGLQVPVTLYDPLAAPSIDIGG